MRLMILSAAVGLIATSSAAQSIINVGQTVSGELSASDPTLDNGSHIDCYDLQTPAGQRLQIDQTAGEFDSFLTVARGGCMNPTEILAQDDDSGGGLNARIARDGDGVLWGVVVGSLGSGATGAYQLRVSIASEGAATRAAAPLAGGGQTLPRVESEFGTDLAQCFAAYGTMDTLRRRGIAPDGYGNLRGIDYAARADQLTSQMTAMDAMTSGVFLSTFEGWAGAPSLGSDAPTIDPENLAAFLTTLGNCDRMLGMDPVTTY